MLHPAVPAKQRPGKSVNKTLLSALKKRLHSTKGKWVNELPGVLWAYRTTSPKPTRESPFAITYGIEAIIPMEIRMPTIRTEIPKEANTEVVIKDLDTVNELREVAAVSITSYQQRLARLHNRCVKLRTFKARELVIRRVLKTRLTQWTRSSNPTRKDHTRWFE